MTTAILIPTYRRPHTVPTLIANIEATAHAPYALYFIVEAEDADTIAAVKESSAGCIVNRGSPSYPACINQALAETSEPLLFCGADDLHFAPGWLQRAVSELDEPSVGVVGCIDPLHPFSDHATHFLLRRQYIEKLGGAMDNPGRVYHPYRHGWTDWELVCVAKVRRAYRFCREAVVNHIHPGWRLDGLVRPDSPLFDATYAKGNEHCLADRQAFLDRVDQWYEAFCARPERSPADEYIIRFIERARHPRRAYVADLILKRRLVRSIRKSWRALRSRRT